ncbi:MAG: helix-turn-helix transcriptional regulator [Clostridiales bacterium]|nr:helix-turn-helix transcriptional regulator [Clostridiales bacterium]
MLLKDKIRNRRKELDMTLEDVSKKVGVSAQTIQKYESGLISNIPSDRIEALAEALEVSPAYLMGWDVNGKPSSPQPTYLSLNRGKTDEVLNDMGALSQDEDEEIANFIAFVKQKRGKNE